MYLYNHSKEQISVHAAPTSTAATGSSRLAASMSAQSWIPLRMSIWSRSMRRDPDIIAADHIHRHDAGGPVQQYDRGAGLVQRIRC